MTDVASNEMDAISMEIEQAKEWINKRDALVRLTSNADFSTVVHEGYFEKEAARLVLLKGESSMEDEKNQKNILDGITGIGQLYQYFRAIMAQGQQCDAAVADYEEELDKMRAEGLD